MSIRAYEGTVKNGRILLAGNVELPEDARVFVIVPNLQAERTVRALSPRLAHRQDAADFEMEVSDESRG